MVSSIGQQDEEEQRSNMDPSVVALLEPLQETATKNEIYTRIAMIKMRQSHILGNSEYAAKVLEDALKQANKSRTAHELLGDRLRKLENKASTTEESNSANDAGGSVSQSVNKPSGTGNNQTEVENNDAEKDSDTADATEVERLKRELKEKSTRADEVETMLDERLTEEINNIKEEREMIRELESRHRDRIRSLQLSVKKIPGKDRREKLQEAMADAYDFTEASSSEPHRRVDCTVCCNREASRAVIPCGHLCLCDECTDTIAASCDAGMRQCPLCRGNLLSTLKIYTAK